MIYAQNTGLIDAVPSVNIGKPSRNRRRKICRVSARINFQVNANNAYGKYQYVNAVLVHGQLLTITRPAEAAEARWEEVT